MSVGGTLGGDKLVEQIHAGCSVQLPIRLIYLMFELN